MTNLSTNPDQPHADGVGGPATSAMDFNVDVVRGGVVATDNDALGAVYKSVNAFGAVYEYFYDANGRRRLKQYPNGMSDEYFYDGDKMLEDRGQMSVDAKASEAHVLDEYVWLDGRPVALLKVRITDPGTAAGSMFTRGADFAADCKRNDAAAPCGVFALVTDYLKKPVLMLDGARRIAGTADYEPFGHVNRVTYLAEAKLASGSAGAAKDKPLAFFSQPAGAGLVTELRARFALVQTGNAESNYAFLTDSDLSSGRLVWLNKTTDIAGNFVDEKIGGSGRSDTVSAWVPVPAHGRIHVRYTYGDTSASRDGLLLEGYEYRRFQSGAKPVWTPLRFPGQYHDAETDLFENWNRYYDPSIGRYLGPDPFALSPNTAISEARQGRSMPPYAYAFGNPLYFTDSTGEIVRALDSTIRPYVIEFARRDPGRFAEMSRSDVLFTFKTGRREVPWHQRYWFGLGRPMAGFAKGDTKQRRTQDGATWMDSTIYVDNIVRWSSQSVLFALMHETEHSYIDLGWSPRPVNNWRTELQCDDYASREGGMRLAPENYDYWKSKAESNGEQADFDPWWDNHFGGELRSRMY